MCEICHTLKCAPQNKGHVFKLKFKLNFTGPPNEWSGIYFLQKCLIKLGYKQKIYIHRMFASVDTEQKNLIF